MNRVVTTMGEMLAVKAMKELRKFLRHFSNVLEIRDLGDKIEIRIPQGDDHGVSRRDNK